jgi:transposase
MSSTGESRSSAEVQAAIRKRVVIYLSSGKGTQQSAADIFMLSLSAVKKIWKRYQLQGDAIIKAHQRGPKQSTCRLTVRQAQQITMQIRQSPPQQHGLPDTLWTAKVVRELIKKRPVSSTRSGM